MIPLGIQWSDSADREASVFPSVDAPVQFLSLSRIFKAKSKSHLSLGEGCMGSLLCFVEVKLMTNSSVRFLSLLNPTVVTHSGFYLRELKWYKGFFLKWMFQGFFCMKGFVVPEVLGNDMFHSKVLRPYER